MRQSWCLVLWLGHVIPVQMKQLYKLSFSRFRRRMTSDVESYLSPPSHEIKTKDAIVVNYNEHFHENLYYLSRRERSHSAENARWHCYPSKRVD